MTLLVKNLEVSYVTGFTISYNAVQWGLRLIVERLLVDRWTVDGNTSNLLSLKFMNFYIERNDIFTD